MKPLLSTLLAARTRLFDELMRRDLLANTRNPLLEQIVHHISEVADMVERTGAMAQTQKRAVHLIDEAIAALAIFPDGGEKTALTTLSRHILQREH